MPEAQISATPFELRAAKLIPRRRFLYGRHYARGFVSCTVAGGGVGKSSLGVVEALAMVTGRPLLGVQPAGQMRVWLWNGEDPLDELERRVAAACTYYDIDAAALGGRLFLDSGRVQKLVLATSARDGLQVNSAVLKALIATIRNRGIDCMIADPFVSSHAVSENDNTAIDLVAKSWADVADATEIAVDIVHHARKTGGAEVTIDDSRGAVALIAAARSVRLLNPMSKDEAARAGVQPAWRYFRVTDGKKNMAPPAEAADWYRRISQPLGNGRTEAEPGDEVAVVADWQWPDPMADVTAHDFDAVASAVRAKNDGRWRHSDQAAEWIGLAVAEALHLDAQNPSDRARIKAMLKTWIAAGSLILLEEQDARRRPRKFVQIAEPA
jgi:hypothetical protein